MPLLFNVSLPIVAPAADEIAMPSGESMLVIDHFDDRGDLDVQVKLKPQGEWHRKAIDGSHTACGEPLGGYATREESYAGKLCVRGCYSPFELARSIAANATTPDRGTR